MTITIALTESVLAGLKQQADRQHVTVEELAGKILMSAAQQAFPETLEELVARIKAMPPNPAMIRPAAGNLAETLRSSPEDPEFNLDEWNHNWMTVEREMSEMTKANDIAEGRRRPN